MKTLLARTWYVQLVVPDTQRRFMSVIALSGLLLLGTFLVLPLGQTLSSGLIESSVGELGAGTGLKGEYFDNRNLTDSKLVRTDATVNFDWGTGTPDPALNPNTFSVRWTGLVLPTYSEEYVFTVEADDGVRLWINDQLIIDHWTDQAIAHTWQGKINLVAGRLYDLKLEYYQNVGHASIELSWSSASQPEQIIPAANFYPTQPSTTPPEELYVTYEENFQNINSWITYELTPSIPESGVLQLTLPGVYTHTWGKLERTSQAYIPIDLYQFPVFRIKVPEVSSGAKWKVFLYKTSPIWQAYEIQSITSETGVYDYNVPMITGWNGRQRLQVILVVEGASGDWVKFDFLQWGRYTPPPAAEPIGYELFARIGLTATATSSQTYIFTGNGLKVYDDNRSEPYPWITYTWNFGDGAFGAGPTVTHTYTATGTYQVMLTAEDDQGHTKYATKDVGATKFMYADYFVGYHSREYSGRSDLWWWYSTEKSPWAARPGDLYAPGSTVTKTTIAYYNPLIGYYDQWDPATIEYSILLAKLAGLDGFAFEFQDPDCPAASLMDKFLPYAQQYDFKMTAQWIPASMYDWNKDQIISRTQLLNMGQEVIQNVTQKYILPSGATYRVNGVERPVWFVFNWDRNQSLPDDELPYTHTFDYGFTKDEMSILRNYAIGQTQGGNPLFLAAAWSYWPQKWKALTDTIEPFPVAGTFDGMYGWMNPDFITMPADSDYYLIHADLPMSRTSDRIGTVEKNLEYFAKEYSETNRLINTGEFVVKSGTVFPGFDDAYNGAWGIGKRRYIPRQTAAGSTLTQSFKLFTANNPDIGLFATFADWAESTSLEPTWESGYDTAILTADEIQAWKSLPAPRFRVYLPLILKGGGSILLTQQAIPKDWLPLVVEVYKLRHRYDFLKQAGYTENDLKFLKQATDNIVPYLLTKEVVSATQAISVAQTAGNALLGQLASRDLVLEWTDESQGATPLAGALPLSMSHAAGSQAFFFPPAVRDLLNSGAYTGTLNFEYRDTGSAFLAGTVNTLKTFGEAAGQSTEILKVQRSGTDQWLSAHADLVNASFGPQFDDRPDVSFEVQGSLAYINNFTHTADALTVAYWVKPDLFTAGKQNQVLILNPNSGAETFVSCMNNAYGDSVTPGLLETYLNLGASIQTLTVTQAFTTTVWTHVVVTWDGAIDLAKVYVNGTLRASGTFTQGALVDNAQQILAGTIKDGMVGNLDELQVYDRALTSNEINVLFNGSAVASSLAGYWKFDLSEGNVITDSAPGHHPAYLYNGARVMTDTVPYTANNPASLHLVSDPGGLPLRRLRIELKAYQKDQVPDFIPAFAEDFSDLRHWTTTTVSATADGGHITVIVPISPTWGQLDRRETGYIKVDLDRSPILRVTVRRATAMWKIRVFDVVTWYSATVKFLGTETGTLDFDLKKITDWSGGPKTLQLQLIVDGGANGGGRYVTFDDLRIGRYAILPDPTYGFVEDFSVVDDWTAAQASVQTDGQQAILTVATGQATGTLQRLEPVALIPIDLSKQPVLQTTVVSATGPWSLELIDKNNGNTRYEIQPATSQTGTLTYDVPALTGMHSIKILQARFVVQGSGHSFTIDDLRFRVPDHPADWYIGYQEDFSEVSDWTTLSTTLTTTQGIATLAVNLGEKWGKMERVEFGRLATVDLDRYPILRLSVPKVNGMWKIVMYDTRTGAEKLVKPLVDEAGVSDLNVKDITGWSGNEVPLQMSIFIDGVEGHYLNPYLKLDDLQFRRDGTPLPAGVFAQEDFDEVTSWVSTSSTLTTSNGIATLTVNPGESWGKMERTNPGRLFNINLDDYPILRLKVVNATGHWSFWLYNVTSGWISREIQSSTTMTGEIDYDVTDITDWSGKDVKLQMIINLADGAGRHLRLDEIQFRRTGHPGSEARIIPSHDAVVECRRSDMCGN